MLLSGMVTILTSSKSKWYYKEKNDSISSAKKCANLADAFIQSDMF